MQIPGDNITALIEAGLAKDPYFGFNEKDVQWVGQSCWSICRTFDYSFSNIMFFTAIFLAKIFILYSSFVLLYS